MVPDTKASGKVIRLMVRASLSMLTAMFTKASGSTIRLKARALILTQMELTTKESGTMTSNTVMVLNLGLMARAMKAHTKTAKKKAKVD